MNKKSKHIVQNNKNFVTKFVFANNFMLPMNKKNSEYFKFHYSERISMFGKGTRKYISFNLLT